MKAIRLHDTLTVAGQITPAQVPQIAAAGFRVLVNNRPDGEESGQPSSAEIEAAAVAAGLEYHHLPVTAVSFPGPDVARVEGLFADAARPVFAFCRTGTRCTNLWVATRSREEREAAAEWARSLGFDLGMADRC